MREKAASGLVEELMASQQQFEQESELESDEEPAGVADGRGGGKGKPVDRALRRCSPLLVRCSPARRTVVVLYPACSLAADEMSHRARSCRMLSGRRVSV